MMCLKSMANIRHKSFALVTICLVVIVGSMGSFVWADASMRLYEDYTPEGAKKDFDALNKWLIKASAWIDDPSVNLNLAKEKLATMNSKHTKWVKLPIVYEKSLVRPIEMLERLSSVLTCDDETLELLRYIHLATKKGQGGYKRVSMVAAHYAHEVAIKCADYIDGRFVDIWSNILNSDDIGRLVDVIEPNSYPEWHKENSSSLMESFDADLAKANTTNEFNDENVYEAMQQMADGDPRNEFVSVRPNERTGNLDKFGLKNNAHYIYDTYLAPPCRYYNEMFRQFVESFYAILDYSDMPPGGHARFVSRRPDYVKLGVFRYLVCDRILNRRSALSEIDRLIEKKRSTMEIEVPPGSQAHW